MTRVYTEEAMMSTEEHRKFLQDFYASQTNWFTYCQVCGRRREGSLQALKEPCGHGHPDS